MNTTKIILAWAVAGWLPSLAAAQEILRQPVVPGTEVAATQEIQPVEVVGTVAQLGDGSLALATQPSLAPVQYRFSQTTQWVDEAGKVVTRETVKTGAPVTLYYTKAPEGLLISKVVVRQQQAPAIVAAQPPTVVEKRETVTTSTQPMEASGVVTTWGDGVLAIRIEGFATPMQYLFSDTTKWIDSSGQNVSRQMLRVGTPVTVFYTKTDQGLVISKAVMAQVATPITEREERIIEQPAPKIIEKRKAVVKEPAPKVSEKRKAGEEKPAPKGVERRKAKVVEANEPAVVERPPVVEQNTTTTTTTTKKKVDDDDDDDDDDD